MQNDMCEKCGKAEKVGTMEITYSLIDSAYKTNLCPQHAGDLINNIKPFLIRSVQNESRATNKADQARGQGISKAIQ